MARLLIGLAASDTATKSVEAVIEYAKMCAIGERLFEGADDFETALTGIFKGEVEDGKFKLDVKEVVICRSWPEAVIILTDERRFTFSTLEPPVHEKQFCRIDYRVGWAFFHDILCALASDADPKPSKAGWDRASKLHKIEQEQGPEAAQKWADENPLIEDGKVE